MSVVGNDFEELKRFNLAEIYQPTPQPISTAMPPPQEIRDASSATCGLQRSDGSNAAECA